VLADWRFVLEVCEVWSRDLQKKTKAPPHPDEDYRRERINSPPWEKFRDTQ